MRSDEIKAPEPEWCTEKAGNKVRLFAYLCALSGRDKRAAQPTSNPNRSGLMKELEKTRLDTCDNA